MGSPVNPIIATLFMENCESLALSSVASTLKFYGHYVDDTMCIIKLSEVDKFTKHLSLLHPAIKLTVDHVQDNKIAKLTLLFTKTRVGVCLSVCIENPHTLINISTLTVINL